MRSGYEQLRERFAASHEDESYFQGLDVRSVAFSGEISCYHAYEEGFARETGSSLYALFADETAAALCQATETSWSAEKADSFDEYIQTHWKKVFAVVYDAAAAAQFPRAVKSPA